MADLDVWLADPFGTRILPLAQFDRLQYTRAVNDIGSLSILLPGHFDTSLARVDGLILVYREGRLETETAWLIRGIKRTTAPKGEQHVELRAVSGNDLLRRRIVAYAAGTAGANEIGPVDDSLKTYVAENLGTAATDTARSLPAALFRVAADDGLGPDIFHAGEWQNLLRLCQDLCKASAEYGTEMFFDTIYLPELSVWEFRTYVGARGTDKSSTTGAPITLAIDRGTIGQETMDDDYTPEVTYAYAGGSGTEGERPVSEYEDTTRSGRSPYGRIETFVSAGSSETVYLEAAARQVVQRGRPRRVYAGDLISNSTSRYGVDVLWGDVVSVYTGGRLLDCRLDAVQYTLDNVTQRGREAVRVRLTNTALL